MEKEEEDTLLCLTFLSSFGEERERRTFVDHDGGMSE
jgi:hypothetical protein